jgi:uncharacterized protein YqiB (DUF1249 family)
MNDEYLEGMKRQWSEAEAYRLKCLEEMRETMRREILKEKQTEIENAVRLALQKAEVTKSKQLFHFHKHYTHTNIRNIGSV